MSQAEDLLNTLSSDLATEEHIVIDNDRYVTVPESLKKIAVQYDHNVRTVTFDCPRFWDERDLSTMTISINYMRPDGRSGTCIAENVSVDEADANIIHFDWTITKHITVVNGSLQFLACASKANVEGTEEEHWNSEINSDMIISKGLEVSEQIQELYPDVIADILTAYRNRPKTTVIDLPVGSWRGAETVFSQDVIIPFVTKNSVIDLRPSPAQLQELSNNNISMVVGNDSGAVTVFAIGGKPSSSYSMQIIISEVNEV